jgi:hypothetical protein
MSRGLGRISRAACCFVQASAKTVDPLEVAAAVYAVEPAEGGCIYPTPAQVVSVRRALAELVRRGEIRDIGRSFRFGHRRYSSHATFALYGAHLYATFRKRVEFRRPIPPRV